MRTLYRHSKREMWGLGIVLRRLDDRLKMVFQDGRRRTFKRGYYHLIDAVDRSYDVTRQMVEALESMVPDENAKESRGKTVKPISMDEQLAYLSEVFPGGFQDEAYAAHHRGDGRKRPLKRHRDALIEAAAATLGRHAMREKLDAKEFTELHELASKVVSLTDLVGAKERKAFAAIGAEHHEDIAVYLFALIHGTSKLSVRFDAYSRALERAMGMAPSWGLATVLPSAINPTEQLAVRAKVVTMQAQWMAPGLGISDVPMGLLYERIVEMVAKVKNGLEDAGFAPRDMFDVSDFMWATLRPAGRKRILEQRAERGLEPVQVVGPKDALETEDSEEEAA